MAPLLWIFRCPVFVHFCFICVLFPSGIHGKKKELDVPDFLAKEVKALEDLASCPLKQLAKSLVLSQWFKDQLSDETVLCALKFLEANSHDDTVWSALGTSYEKRNLKQQANYCFKQAVKIVGKYTQFIKDWWFIGPFVVGKTEFDGDALAAFGGIQNVSKFRHQSEIFYSELAPGGVVKWRELKQSQAQELLKVSPKIEWNDLVSSLGSMGITEWQGWAVGELLINEEELQLSFQCLGVAKCFIGDTIIVGDLYHRNQFWFPVALSRGVHTVFIPLRTKVTANFKFSVYKMPTFKVLEPSFLPDMYNGHLPGNFYLSIPVSNLMTDKWLKITKIKITDQSDGQPLQPVLINNDYDIAPGQVRPVVVHLKPDSLSSDLKVTGSCKDINLQFKIFTSEGAVSFKLTLRCRDQGSSFLFSFIDHDGSVQHAAAIEPLGSCGGGTCPVFLTLHGTTVPPQNQADSHKKMVKGEFQFGINGMWLLAPTRHGAHNWEGPGALTALSALEALSTMVTASEWFPLKVDSNQVLFAGHSMGGHGAWHLATHFPDRTIGLISLAGWIKKEEYGESNLFFRHDISTSHVDASVKAIMEACIGENDADRHITNLKDISVLVRIGAEDRTVHPFYVRRMVRLLKEARVNVTYSELPNLGHWWWDTKDTNDGGCVNDAHIRKFIAHIATASRQVDFCTADSKDCQLNADKCQSSHTDPVTLVTSNPAFGDGLKGVSVLQQIIPLRISKIEISINGNSMLLRTQNVKCLKVKGDVPNRPINYHLIKNIIIDGTTLSVQEKDFPYTFCIQGTSSEIGPRWESLRDLYLKSQMDLQRGPHNYGPARRIAENRFLIVVGTMGGKSISEILLTHATYIANQFYLTSDTLVPIVEDIHFNNFETGTTMYEAHNRAILRNVYYTSTPKETWNHIILGSPQENLLSGHYLKHLPDLTFQNKTDGPNLRLGDLCVYQEAQTGILTLAPNGHGKLAMILMGLSIQGLMDIVDLATPTIPPMARSPFSNLLPDFVVTGPDVKLKGPGGFLCAGFWDNSWRFAAASSSCACQAN